MTEPGGDMIAFRCECGAKIKMSAATAGKRCKCPKCGAAVRIPPASAKAVAGQQAAARSSDDGEDAAFPSTAPAARGASPADELTLSPLAPTAARSAPPTPRRSVPPREVRTPEPAEPVEGELELAPLEPVKPIDEPPAGPPVTCPSCGRAWPTGTKICVDCGVFVASGRSIVTSQEDNLDAIYERTKGLVFLIRWIVWFGLLPFASEAFGLYRPYVIRAIAILTLIISIGFFFVIDDDQLNGGDYGTLMLWGGDPDNDPIDWADIANEMRDNGLNEQEVADAIAGIRKEVGGARHPFEPYQLVTHQFLHADAVHLIGNLIFVLVFGSRVNALIGQVWTLVLYPLLGIAAAAAHLLASRDLPWHPMIGASGALMGLAGMYLVLFPIQKVHLIAWLGVTPLITFYQGIFTVRGFWVVSWYIAWDVFYVLLNAQDNVAYWAHIGGFCAGVIVAALLLITRMVNARGADVFSVALGRRAWMIVGRPRA